MRYSALGNSFWIQILSSERHLLVQYIIATGFLLAEEKPRVKTLIAIALFAASIVSP